MLRILSYARGSLPFVIAVLLLCCFSCGSGEPGANDGTVTRRWVGDSADESAPPVWPDTTDVVVHAFVPLCDNKNQGIVPVPEALGNGDDPANNLYWGAMYGVKTYLVKSPAWKLLETQVAPWSNREYPFKPMEGVIERCVFFNAEKRVFLVADAYRGSEMRNCVEDFLMSCAGQEGAGFAVGEELHFKSKADLSVFIGHNGLMDFTLEQSPKGAEGPVRGAMVLACKSKSYFGPPLVNAGAYPLLWTTGLMAPEAYVLEAALDAWMKNGDGEAVSKAAAGAYEKYQKLAPGGAASLFATGW